MEERFICRPANHVIKEITKRGVVTQRKDKETQQVVKSINEYGNGSMFGWGAVDKTLPTPKKDLEDLRNNLAAVINQIRPHQTNPIPEEDDIDELFEASPKPTKRRKSNYNRNVQFERRVLQQVESGSNHATLSERSLPTSPLLQWWYNAWSKEHQIGNIGKVPEGFDSTECPSFEQVQQSTAGKVLGHFCTFVKGLF